ncbi:hypothetical protein P280DRAFT_547493 [Massarina eburnea CBS 473.64]|uniref:Uncharacterized protein n=1 Tax=Massarina eburnea CBS 473.64 TaxID=1395130 RepID=A0A6A6SAY1_9PLEO|nr:hypothetical protein P280DRAFT_547493 [Massarina eburnea CBS 473.64]
MDPATNISSPLKSLIPYISPQDAAIMAYPPNSLPGGRNVMAFYGPMRVYEWGPLDGEKVFTG